MKALSVRQPWASLIIRGIKRVENRRWRTPYRGRLLIHAAASRASLAGCEPLPDEELVFAAILGTVELVDCVRLEDAPTTPFTEGPWCWLLEHPKPFHIPIPYRGQQWVFTVPDEFIRNPAACILRQTN